MSRLLARAQRSAFAGAVQASSGSKPAWDHGWYVADPSGFWLPGGSHVSVETAQTLSAVWQGIRLRAEGIASVPCHVFVRRPDGGKERARSGSELGQLEYRLRWQPNAVQTAFEFWELAQSHIDLRGWFIAELVPGPSGFADQLIPRHPDRVQAKRQPNGRVVYEVRHELDSRPRQLTQDEVFVVRARTSDGLTPLSFITYGAQSLSGALAAQQMTANFFKRGTPAIAVISKDELGDTGKANLHNSVMTYVTGSDGSFGVLPLEGDITVEKLGLTPADSKLLEMKGVGVEDVARWLNIPLHMMRMNNAGTNSYASLEVFSAEFVTYGLRNAAIRIEQAIQRDLIVLKDRAFSEFLLDALLRGNLEQRAKFYQSAILTGWMTRNEAREKENLNPADGLDRFLEPHNTAQLDDSGDRRGSAQARVFHAAAGRMRDAFRASMLAHDLATRILRRERGKVTEFATKHANDPDRWKAALQDFYEDHAGFVASTLRIPVEKAREYAAAHGAALVDRGVVALDAFETDAGEQLALWALEGCAAA